MKKVGTTLLAALFALALIIPSTANAATSSSPYYTVQSGDTMWNISKKLNVSFNSLVQANPQIKNPSFIYVGEQIHIPSSSTATKGKTYTVQSGDTMWKIASRLGVSYNALLQANPQVKNPSVIYAGETLNVPGQSQSVGSSSGQTSGSTSKSSVLSPYEQQVLNLTNQQREKYGLAPLKVSVSLSKMSGVKAADMRDHNYFSHYSPTYGSPFQMMKDFGISYTYAGENIAAGQPTPQAVVTAWMNSPGHRANILNSHYTEIGIGYVKGGSYGSYWVQDFISP